MKKSELNELKSFVVSSQYHSGVREEYSDVYSLNDNFDFRVIVFPEDGIYLIVDASLMPFRDQGGEIPTAFVISEDTFDFDVESTLNHLRELDKLGDLYV